MMDARRIVGQAIGPEDRRNVKPSGRIFKLTHYPLASNSRIARPDTLHNVFFMNIPLPTWTNTAPTPGHCEVVVENDVIGRHGRVSCRAVRCAVGSVAG